MKYGHYGALLDTWVRRIAPAMHLEESCEQELLIRKTCRRVLMARKDCQPLTKHNDFEYRLENNPGYFALVNG